MPQIIKCLIIYNYAASYLFPPKFNSHLSKQLALGLRPNLMCPNLNCKFIRIKWELIIMQLFRAATMRLLQSIFFDDASSPGILPRFSRCFIQYSTYPSCLYEGKRPIECQTGPFQHSCQERGPSLSLPGVRKNRQFKVHCLLASF